MSLTLGLLITLTRADRGHAMLTSNSWSVMTLLRAWRLTNIARRVARSGFVGMQGTRMRSYGRDVSNNGVQGGT